MTNNTMETTIEKNVMRRVKTIHMLRPFVSGGALAAVLFVAAMWGIGREVWVAKVFANGPQSLFGHGEYLAYAFTHTRFVVQALTLVSLASVIYLARETARAVGTLFSIRYA